MRRDKRIATRIEEWFAANARDLPWRNRVRGRRNPYYALVSEAMLQQTQASRVAERFDAFIAMFPNVRTLAAAPEDGVLSMWQGLGYYRRATNLHRAAQRICEEHSGLVPADINELKELPGVGAYSAGAIASIAFDRRTPIVDANVERVILRVEGESLQKGSTAAATTVWKRAGELVHACDSPALLNEGIMELGALHCLPRNPMCESCPLKRLCRARRDGLQNEIPGRAAAKSRKPLYCGAAVLRDNRGRILLERRPDHGLWRRLWQPPVLERTDRPPTRSEVARHCNTDSASLLRIGDYRHLTTHREVRFEIWSGSAERNHVNGVDSERILADTNDVDQFIVGSAQRRVLQIARKSHGTKSLAIRGQTAAG